MKKDRKVHIFDQIKRYQVVNFATSLHDQPFLRPLVMFNIQNEYYIATGTADRKMEQLKVNPLFELSIDLREDDKTGYIRLSGSAEIIEDLNTKSMVFEKIDFIRNFWDSPDHPGYTLLKLNFIRGEYLAAGELTAERFTV